MKKYLFVFFALLTLIPVSIFSADSNVFVETVAGSMRVRGEKIGVITTYTGIVNSKNPSVLIDDPLASGLRMELINKGAIVKVFNPAGMEQILNEFIDVKKGKFSTREDIASDAGISYKNFMTNTKGDITNGVQLLEKLLSTNEYSGEVERINDYSNLYKKVLDLWDINKLITVTRINQFSVVVKGYDVETASATLIFQYEIRATKDNWQKINQWKDEWKINGNFGYNIAESADIKYEFSNKRTVELIKRVSEFLKDGSETREIKESKTK
jgi:hypothetical protein